SSLLRRIGCGLLLVIWFAILMLPCFLFVLATQGEIAVSQGNVPGQQLRLWLISEPDQRGFAFSSAAVHATDENAVCVETSVRFLLWTGRAEPVSYCECYDRTDAESAWTYTSGGAQCSG